MSAHDHCTHPKTKSGRAACRRAAAKGVALPTPKVAPLATEIQTPVEPTATIREVADVTIREMALRAQIDSYQLEMTREKVAKINARAERKGLAGTLTMTVEEVEVTETNELTKISETWTEYKVEILGNAPAYNGWEFIAKLEWDYNAGLIVRNVPGVESQVNRETVKEGYCDHCKTTRQRLVTYVVRNQESGETLQVGSSCLKDFTGQFTTISFPELKGDDDSEGGFFGAGGEREYDPTTVLAVAWACVKLEGFKPANSYGSTTKNDVRTALSPSKSKNDREWAAKIAPLADEAKDKAAQLLAWILSDDFAGTTDYVLNMKAVAAGKAVSARNIGLLASAPQAWAKALERTLVREREASVYAASEYIGTAPDKEQGIKGSRETLTVEIKAIKYLDSDYGSTTLYTMITEDGNVVKWFASKDTLGEEIGARYVIRGTVKAHKEWEGMKSTSLTRCSIVDELPAAE